MSTTTADQRVSAVTVRPRYDGANIRTWVGFRQFLAMAEETVLGWFRERGAGPQRLYHEFGLGLSIVDSSGLLPAVLEVDDEVTGEARLTKPGRFAVTLTVERAGTRTVTMRGKVTVALVEEHGAPVPPAAPADVTALLPDLGTATSVVVPAVTAADAATAPPALDAADDDPMRLLAPPGSGVFGWTWRARYPLCHYSDRLQHSSYVAALEEVVDRFLAERGISVGRMLAERGWIPVVSRARVRMLADVHMEEEVHTTFTVTDVLKNLTWEARMDCYVAREGRLTHTATASILHGYAISRGSGAGGLAELDEATVAALTGGRR
ncbi:thioesterase family protein [Salinactinospora qingdaonensis]|uniref:Acyl-CoA thioesterase FadM n=1 Tax=Salinactinospora qingdaonensis TaxID=702744 RepID=A0ABP7F8Z9_9ACTN